MGRYEVREIGRDQNSVIVCKLTFDDQIIFKSMPFSVVMDYVYTLMKEGDTYQEVHLDSDPSPIFTYAQIQSSLGKKLFDEKRGE